MSTWTKQYFGDFYLTPSRNGVSKPSRVRGSGYPMVNMKEIFAYDRIVDEHDMEFVPLNVNTQTPEVCMRFCLSHHPKITREYEYTDPRGLYEVLLIPPSKTHMRMGELNPHPKVNDETSHYTESSVVARACILKRYMVAETLPTQPVPQSSDWETVYRPRASAVELGESTDP